MFDDEFRERAKQHLDVAAELRLDGFRQFAYLAMRLFPGFFESLGFPRSESEQMTALSIERIELDLDSYRQGAKEKLDAWISGHLEGVAREAISKLRSAQAELTGAASIQRVLLLRTPSVPGLEIAAHFRAARAVSGDFHDIVKCSDGSYLIAVGDASGKGAAAALYATLTLGLLRSRAMESSDPVSILAFINKALLVGGGANGEAYITLTLAKWEPTQSQMRIANAGGSYPLRMAKNGSQVVKVDGQWLGTFSMIEPETQSIAPTPSETIAMLSDGIVDQWSGLDHYGEHRLASVIARYYELPLFELVHEVFADIDTFRGSEPMQDDQTLVLIRRTE